MRRQVARLALAGGYILQWTWFGVGMSYRDLGQSEPQFRSCADFRLTTSGTKPRPTCPTFVGCDRVTRQEGKGGGVCLYFHANHITNAVFKSKDYEKEYKFGILEVIEKCWSENPSEKNANSSVANVDNEETADEADSPEPSDPTSPSLTLTPAPSPATNGNDSCRRSPSNNTSKCSVKMSSQGDYPTVPVRITTA